MEETEEPEREERPAAAPRVEMRAVRAAEAGLRLDRWFQRCFPSLPHGHLQKLLRTGQIRVDGRRVKSGTRLAAGNVVRVPPLFLARSAGEPREPPAPSALDSARLRAAVIHRDDDILAINKPPGLAVQGGSGTHWHLDGMLDALRFDAEERPRLVHRLDRDTSGVLLLARNAAAADHLGAAFRRRKTRKLYWAIVVGLPSPDAGVIRLALRKGASEGGERVRVDAEGKRAVTAYRVLDHAASKVAWLALMPLTGRTHQLRAHCAAIGTPILGDGKYGGARAFLTAKDVAKRVHLHARAIEISTPAGKRLRLLAELPETTQSTFDYFGFEPTAEADAFFTLPEAD